MPRFAFWAQFPLVWEMRRLSSVGPDLGLDAPGGRVPAPSERRPLPAPGVSGGGQVLLDMLSEISAETRPAGCCPRAERNNRKGRPTRGPWELHGTPKGAAL